MDNQIWSWILTLVGVSCFFLAGRKIWWAWYIGLAGQVAWLAYSFITEQWGFLVGVVLYTVVYSNNAWKWTSERFYPMPANYEGLIPRPRGKERHVAARHAAAPGADNWVGRTLGDELDARQANAVSGREFDRDYDRARERYVNSDFDGKPLKPERDPGNVGPAPES